MLKPVISLDSFPGGFRTTSTWRKPVSKHERPTGPVTYSSAHSLDVGMRPHSCRSPHNPQLRGTHSLALRACSFISIPGGSLETRVKKPSRRCSSGPEPNLRGTYRALPGNKWYGTPYTPKIKKLRPL